ncbi:hypothetical protein PC9H_007231 [Pleurotus ostreatus]|uniref:Uncharacterized protein n=1 Tax=Pleurotus ostreatus TaxID=5322 RepID=A0A8H7DRC1_PLEOS|nr:uncharacterized protein PC9H_007231 [Pleurotus ostreatus]KAF7428012.1 hypothetical protein PC9H_007231 [Pleurotus ostreatus]
MAPATARDVKPGHRWRSPLRSILFGARNSASHVRNIGRQVAPETTALPITTILVSVTSATRITPTSTTGLAKETLGTDRQPTAEPSRIIDSGWLPATEATTEAPTHALPFQGAARSSVTAPIIGTTEPPGVFVTSTDSQNDSVPTATNTELPPTSTLDTGVSDTLEPLRAFTNVTSAPTGFTDLPEQTSIGIDSPSTSTSTTETPNTGTILSFRSESGKPTGIIATTTDVTSDEVLIPTETSTIKIITLSNPPDGVQPPRLPKTILSPTDDPGLNEKTITHSVEPTVAPTTLSTDLPFGDTPSPTPTEQTGGGSTSEASPFPQISDLVIDTRTPGVLAGASTPTSAPISSDSVSPATSDDGTLLPNVPSIALSSANSSPSAFIGGFLTTSLVGTGTEAIASSPTASPNTPGSNNASAAAPKSSNKGTIIAAVVGVMVALGFGLVMIMIVRRIRRTQFMKNGIREEIISDEPDRTDVTYT